MPLYLQADCTCTPPASLQEALEQADYAFVGEVVGVNTNWISGGMKYTFRVDSSWKKAVDEYLIINTGWEQDCGATFEPGASYLVFVRKKFTPKTDRCMGNRPVGAAMGDIPLPGTALPPSRSPSVTLMYWVVGILGVLSLLFIAAIVLRKYFSPQNRS